MARARYKKLSDLKFVNPYFFIQLQEKCTRSNDFSDLENNPEDYCLTGYIKCELETLSPIFIPNTTVEDVFKKREELIKKYKKKVKDVENIHSYDFFSYIDYNFLKKSPPDPPKSPIIPGSELHGMIRSAFEALTNSCLSSINKDELLYKRYYKDRNSGYLTYNNEEKYWYIQKTVISPFDEKKNFKFNFNSHAPRRTSPEIIENDDGSCQITFLDNQTTIYDYEYIRYGEPFGDNYNKGYFFVFTSYDSDGEKLGFIKLSDDIVERLINHLYENIKLYNKKSHNIYKKKGIHTGYSEISNSNYFSSKESFKQHLKKTGLSIFYDPDELHNPNHIYLDVSQIGRNIFKNKLKDVISNYLPCPIENKICPSCFLFGFSEDEEGKQKSLGSRIRFSDAKIRKSQDLDKLYFKEGFLPELASPKITATEFYLKKLNNNAAIWNYDFYQKWKNNSIQKNKISYDENDYPLIRGRKFYWHGHFTQSKFLDPTIHDVSRNVYARLLNSCVKFKFKIYFNNVHKSELKKLLWILDIGQDPNKAFKIGMGKPLGLGSINIKVKDVKFRALSINNSQLEYQITNKDTNEKIKQLLDNVQQEKEPWNNILGCNEEIYNKFLDIIDINNPKGSIEYPNNLCSTESFKWFHANRNYGQGVTDFSPKIDQALPNNSKEPFLFKYQYVDCDHQGKMRKREEKLKKKYNDDKRFFGTIKSINKIKNEGFICSEECEDLKFKFEDISKGIEEIDKVNRGTKVSYKVQFLNNKPSHAINIILEKVVEVV